MCLNELTNRRIALQEEITALLTEMSQETESDSTSLSKYDDRIYGVMIKALILSTIAKKTISVDLSTVTCSTILDKMSTNPKIKKQAVDMFFSSFAKVTNLFLYLESMQKLLDFFKEHMPKEFNRDRMRKRKGTPPDDNDSI